MLGKGMNGKGMNAADAEPSSAFRVVAQPVLVFLTAEIPLQQPRAEFILGTSRDCQR
jgi:hypothetical protein